MLDLAILKSEFDNGLYKKTVELLAKEIHNEPLPDEIRSILTALGSYGEVSPHRQAENMRELAGPKRPINSNNEIAKRLVELASRLQS
jgi:hypothetical protein